MQKIIFMIFAGWICLGLNLFAGELPLPGAVLAQFDASWQETFSRELADQYAASYLNPSSLTLLGHLLEKEKFPADPAIAARDYFFLAIALDRNLKQGASLTRLKVKLKQTWKRFVLPPSSAETPESTMVTKLKPPKIKDKDKLLADKVKKIKDEKDKIKDEKDKIKDEKDKEDKDKKEKEDKDK